ncbi:hypothetical protein ACQJBY_044104 [Aegilops geniculata]
MEFSRRGPAPDDPPPHGEAMLVMRDALLWQLQKDRLRQEIIMAELAKIERTMALRAVSGHGTPMPRDMPQHKGPVFGWEHDLGVGEVNDVKLPSNYGRQSAEPRSWNPIAEDRAEKCWNPCKCRVNSGEYNSAFDEHKLQDSSENVPPNKASPVEKWELTGITIPVKKPKPPMSPRKRKKPPTRWICPVCQVQVNSAQKHCAGKKHQSNIATLESNIKAIGYQKPPLAGCSICQVMCGSESNLEIHLTGKRHLKKIQALFEESNNKAINSESLKANLNPDSGPLHVEKMNCDLYLENHLRDERHKLNVPEISKEQTPSSEWDCTMCQAKCVSKAHFENHCISRKHQQRTQVILSECNIMKTGTKMGNIHMEASCKEGSNNDMAKNVASQEAKSHESNVPEHAEKPPSVQSCNICQGICDCAPDFDMPQHVDETSCKLSWESYLRPRDESLQLLDDWALREKINQDKSNPPEMSKDQISSSEWDCATCQAKYNSEPQTEHHCKSGKHQQKIDVTLHESDIAEVSSLNAAPCKEDNNSHMDVAPWEANSDECIVSQHVEKPPSVWCCSDCQVICARESDFEVHLKRERHLMKIGALLKESKNMPISESQKANLYLDSVPQHVEKMNCELDLENNHGDERHQLNVCSPCKENSQMKNNPPQIVKDQEPPSEWDCAMCKDKCNSEPQIEHHSESRRHQQKTVVTLREGDIAIVNSLHITASCKEGDNNSMGITAQEAKSDENNVQQHAEKPPPAWDCSDCQVTCNRESDLVFHLNGKRHLKKFRALLEESKNKAMNSESQTANLNQDSVPQPAEKTNCKLNWESYLRLRDEKHQLNVQACEAINIDKNSPAKKDQIPSSEWDCAMYQAKCNSEAQLEHHCTSRKHWQKTQVVLGEGDIANVSSLCLEAPCKEGSNNDMAKNIVSQEAKLHEKYVPKHAEKPPLVGCSICQVICGRGSDLEIHLTGKRHLKIRTLLEESNKAINSESLKANLNLDSGPLHVEKMNCDLDSENHLRNERHELNVWTLCETINQEENSPPEISKEQTPSSEWDCAMCQAKCVSKAHFENHCISRKHQQRTQVILSECDITKTGNLHMDASCKGRNNDMASNIAPQEANSEESNVSQHAEKPPSVESCNICQGICNCAPDYDIPQHVQEMICKLNWESYPGIRDESLQPMDDRALREKFNQYKSNPPEISKDQIPFSEWDCAICQAKCNSEPQIEHHCRSGKHEQKIDVTLHEGDIAEVSSLIAAPCKEGNNSHMGIAPQEAKSDEGNVSQHAEKPPSVWGCSDCQVICGRESDFEVHLKGERHLKKIGTLLEESKNMAISESQKANLYPDSVPQHAEKMNCELDLENNLRDEGHQLNVRTPWKENSQMKNNTPEIVNDQEPPSEWDCAMCQEKCNSESQIEHHCESRRNQQKTDVILREGDIAIVNSLHIAASCKEGDNNSTGITPQEAKSDENNVQQHAEKPPPAWDCSDCQVTCNRESDLVFHLNGKRHLKKFRALLEESKNKAMNSESQTANLNQDSVPQHADKTNCKPNWESYLRLGDEKHQLNVQAIGEAINQDENSLSNKDQILPSEWDCAMCQAKCNSKAQFEHHCTSRKHQQKIQVILGEGGIARVSSLHMEASCKEGSNNDMVNNVVSQDAKSHEKNVPQHAEKPPLVGCSICRVICGRESDLEVHLKGKRHLKKIRALFEESNKAINSESLKANLNLDSGPLNVKKMDCDLDSENHLRDERHQEENNPPEIFQDQTPSSEWDCVMCQAKCHL